MQMRKLGISRRGILAASLVTVAVSGASATAFGASTPQAASAHGRSIAGGVADARARVAAYSAVPKFSAPGPAFNARKVMRGKLVYDVPYSTNIPFITGFLDGQKTVARQVGFRFKIWNSTGDPSAWVQGFDAAITARASVIDTGGNDPRSLVPNIRKAASAGIPVVATHAFSTQWPTPASLKSLRNLRFMNAPYYLAGRLLGDRAIDVTNGKGNILILSPLSFSYGPVMVAGMTEEFKRDCPACKWKIQDAPVTTWATTLQSAVQSTLTANPDVNYIIAAVDAIGPPTIAALQATQLTGRIKIGTFNGTPSDVKLVADGKLDIDIGESVDWIGYAMMDADMRVVAGLPVPKNPGIPLRIFSAKNVSQAGDPPVATKGYGRSYITGYRKLWKLQK